MVRYGNPRLRCSSMGNSVLDVQVPTQRCLEVDKLTSEERSGLGPEGLQSLIRGTDRVSSVRPSRVSENRTGRTGLGWYRTTMTCPVIGTRPGEERSGTGE